MKPAPLPAAAPGGPLRIGSLCTGYGGLDLAVTAVLAAELAWYAEPDPHAAAVLTARWPGTCFGDITALDWAHVPPVDLITAGWPCQDISGHAGHCMNRPVHAPVSPAGPPTPPPGYHARVGGPAARVAAAAPRAAGRASGTPVAAGGTRRPDGGAVLPAPAITQPRDLTPRAETGVDAAGPGRQASRTCPRHHDPAPAPQVAGPRRRPLSGIPSESCMAPELTVGAAARTGPRLEPGAVMPCHSRQLTRHPASAGQGRPTCAFQAPRLFLCRSPQGRHR